MIMPYDLPEIEPKSAKTKLFFLRFIVYVALGLVTFICLFFFVLMIINCTKTNSQLQGGFSMVPSTHFFENIKNAINDRALVNIAVGMKNSFLVAAASSILSVYF